jgi:hypothetical protein
MSDLKKQLVTIFSEHSGGDGFEPDWESVADLALQVFHSQNKKLLEKVKKLQRWETDRIIGIEKDEHGRYFEAFEVLDLIQKEE